VGSFHGGGLVTKEPSSPHLLIDKTNAAFVVAVAQNDDMQDPAAKDVLKKTFADTKKKATVEVFGANHGWCVKDGAAYNEAQAEKAWGELMALYKATIV
jgi:carboxymethylenebutenolidase